MLLPGCAARQDGLPDLHDMAPRGSKACLIPVPSMRAAPMPRRVDALKNGSLLVEALGEADLPASPADVEVSLDAALDAECAGGSPAASPAQHGNSGSQNAVGKEHEGGSPIRPAAPAKASQLIRAHQPAVQPGKAETAAPPQEKSGVLQTRLEVAVPPAPAMSDEVDVPLGSETGGHTPRATPQGLRLLKTPLTGAGRPSKFSPQPAARLPAASSQAAARKAGPAAESWESLQVGGCGSAAGEAASPLACLGVPWTLEEASAEADVSLELHLAGMLVPPVLLPATPVGSHLPAILQAHLHPAGPAAEASEVAPTWHLQAKTGAGGTLPTPAPESPPAAAHLQAFFRPAASQDMSGAGLGDMLTSGRQLSDAHSSAVDGDTLHLGSRWGLPRRMLQGLRANAASDWVQHPAACHIDLAGGPWVSPSSRRQRHSWAA